MLHRIDAATTPPRAGHSLYANEHREEHVSVRTRGMSGNVGDGLVRSACKRARHIAQTTYRCTIRECSGMQVHADILDLCRSRRSPTSKHCTASHDCSDTNRSMSARTPAQERSQTRKLQELHGIFKFDMNMTVLHEHS